MFKRFDTNKNGYLEIQEYSNCIKEVGIKLTQSEIQTLALSADLNHDNQIDYEEFMKHFQQFIHMVRFQNLLNDAANTYKDIYKEEKLEPEALNTSDLAKFSFTSDKEKVEKYLEEQQVQDA